VVTGVIVHLQVQGRFRAARQILDHADDLTDVAVARAMMIVEAPCPQQP